MLGDFALIARCSVPLAALVRSRPLLSLVNYPMFSVNTNQVVAHINIDIRLALPISELFKLFLERNPNEKQIIEDISNKRLLETAKMNETYGAVEVANIASAVKEEESRLYNELDIIIHKAVGLPNSLDQKPPTSFVHFQFLGHPDRFTNPVPNSCAPEFNEKFTFPIITNDQQIRLLQRTKLQISIFDLKGEELDRDSDGLIGGLNINLSDLAEGLSIVDTFKIQTPDGDRVGDLHISIRWRHAFRRSRELGPRSISGIEVETLIAAFSPNDFEAGIIDYKSFCRFIDPPEEVMQAIEKLKLLNNEIMSKDGKHSVDNIRVLFNTDNLIDEETFLSKILRTQIDILPSDLRKLFQYIDNNGDYKVTVEKIEAVLNLDTISGISVSLQNKLRRRSKELLRLGKSPIVLFQEADQWGSNGLVTRMEFKNVLKLMGFSLVDEPEVFHNDKNMLTVKNKEGLQDDILNDSFGSNDDVLIQQDIDSDIPIGAINKRSIHKHLAKQREIFEARKNELKLNAELYDQLQSETKASKELSDDVGYSNYKSNDTPVNHRSSMKGTGAKVDSSFLKDNNLDIDKSVTALQSRYRGYKARKNLTPPTREDNIGIAMRNLETQSEKVEILPGGPSQILIVENIIDKQLRSQPTQFHITDDLLNKFVAIDAKKQGFVKRAQFAHVLSQQSTIKLYGAELKSCMNYFDLEGTGENIDYTAFISFCRYKEPEILPAIQRLRTIILNNKDLLFFERLDTDGTGSITRPDAIRILADLGLGNVSQAVILSMIKLFETQIEGRVNYVNLLQFLYENPDNQLLSLTTAKMYEMTQYEEAGGENGDQKARMFFSKIDSNLNGAITPQELYKFLSENATTPCSKEIVFCIFKEIGENNKVIDFGKFLSWCKEYRKLINKKNSFLTYSLPMVELKRKTTLFLQEISNFMMPSIESIGQSYKIYDWKRSSFSIIHEACFIRATKRCGFPYTVSEIKLLATEFMSETVRENVDYIKFLQWTNSAISKQSLKVKLLDNIELTHSTQKSAGNIIRHLEKAIARGIDVLSVFRRYDSNNLGRITSSEFCSALSDLGLSSVIEREALETADRYTIN